MTGTCYFFGTFTPIHLGHLMMAEACLWQFGFQRVVFVPAFVPPHRQQESDMLPFAHRLALVERAIRSNPAFAVTDIERCREGPSYTVETLKLLVPGFEADGSVTPVIMGQDALKGLPTWHKPEVMINRVLFLQAPRDHQPPVQSVLLDGVETALMTQMIDMPCIPISSTLIRKRILAGQSIQPLVPQAVYEYLAWNNLLISAKPKIKAEL